MLCQLCLIQKPHISPFLDVALQVSSHFPAGWQEFHGSQTSRGFGCKTLLWALGVCSSLQLTPCSVLSFCIPPTPIAVSLEAPPKAWDQCCTCLRLTQSDKQQDSSRMPNCLFPESNTVGYSSYTPRTAKLQTWPPISVPITINQTPITPNRTRQLNLDLQSLLTTPPAFHSQNLATCSRQEGLTMYKQRLLQLTQLTALREN